MTELEQIEDIKIKYQVNNSIAEIILNKRKLTKLVKGLEDNDKYKEILQLLLKVI